MNELMKDRTDRLLKLGLKFNGEYFVSEDNNVQIHNQVDVLCKSDEEFDKMYHDVAQYMGKGTE